MKDRGMKKWIPFNALVEQKGEIHKSIKHIDDRETILSEDQEFDINRALKENFNKKVKIGYILNNKITIVTGILKKSDTINDFIYIDKKKIKLKTIIFVEL